MEKLQLHNTHSPLFALLLFLLHFSSLQFLSLAYTPPNKYFINCGSASNVNAALRNFVGDSNSSDSISASVSLSGQSSTVNQSSDASPLYQTARIFRQNSAYEFNIEDPGTYFVRFHFFAFSSPTTLTDLSTALFDVSTSEFSLLLNFTPGKNSNSPILKEFLLSINQEKFRIYFVPRGSSFAFINAIEVFLAPPDLISDEAPLMHVSPAGLSNNNYTGVLSKSLQSIYRINVGGPALTPDNDTLWRNWVPDDGYIYNPGAAIDTPPHSGRPNYQGTITEFTAPYLVYQTAKQMNTNYQSSLFNITWSFSVSKSAAHLVRFHFCDIISTSPATLKFNLYISRNFGFKIDSHDYAGQLNVPFYVDFVVDSDESGLMNVSIGTRNDFDQYNAYLNGLEIKEILHHSGSGSVHKNNHVFLVAGSVIGGSVLICILVVILFLVFKCVKPKHGKTSSLPSYLCRYFSLTEIRAATNNFDDVFIIGVGGFGNVYKGYIDDGATPVAIKRLNPGSQQGAHEFKTEIEMLSQLRHLNLVHLIGYCNHGCEMILVYDYMTRGTLRDHLYNTDNPPLLWKQRLKICIGAAHGLNYLHTGAKQTIIHRDVKTTNILLDEKWVAKVSDFGLSKVGPNGMSKSHVSTVVKGSFGYLDPEYYRRQQLTEKSDVYSFGVVLCEVLCAKPPIMQIAETAVGLARWARENYRNGKVTHMVDPSLNGEIRTRCLKKFVEIAGKCLHEDRIERPSMNEVVRGLEFALQLQDSADEDVLLDVAETETMDDERAHFPKSTLDDSDDMSSRSGGQVSSTNSNSRVTIMSNSRVTSLGSNLNLGSKMPFAEIQFVTNNFDKKLVIGKGGFGIVYRGTFRDGKKVAVKRSKPGSNQGLLEFHTEIMVLSKIRHRNLVQLIGYCDERSEIILVYEFMEKGTLRDHLYASDKPPLSWKRRLEICMGAARGLQYLHKGSAGGIIHSDVKSTNILLDENHVAKVADFGLSKTGPLDETHVSTAVKGTFGYLDPEHQKTQQLTEKSDVYSFGVVLLEVLCARPPIDQTLQREEVNLAEWAMICKKKGLLEEIVDPSVKGQIDPNSLRKFVETTEKCLQDCGADRPNMVDVLWDLEYALQLQQNAMWRATLGQHNQFLGSIRDAVSFN